MTTTVTTTETSTLPEYTRMETIDIEFARELKINKQVPEEERSKLKRYLKKIINGNQVCVDYVLGKTVRYAGEDLGRLVPINGIGLQNFKRNVRSALAKNYYFDVDIVNAAPTILVQYAEQRGWNVDNLKRYTTQREELLQEVQSCCGVDRSEAKERVNKIIFGGSAIGMPEFFCNEFTQEIRRLILNINNANIESLRFLKKSGKGDRSGIAYIYQTEERKCLLALDKALGLRGRSLEVFIHDGGLVRKKENETIFPPRLLRECEAEIEKETGYKISLLVKPMETDLERADENENLLPPDILVDDVFAARRFVELMGEYIIRDGNQIFLFDVHTGIWSDDEGLLDDKITEAGQNLIFRQVTDKTETIYNYSGVVSRRNNLKSVLCSVLPNKKDYFKDRVDTDIGKLLFANGIYDFKTDTFSLGFNHQIIFKNAIPRDFPNTRDLEKEAFVMKTFFRDPFRNPAVGDIFLHYVARGLSGDYKMKKTVVNIGPTNSSKGTFNKFLRLVCGSDMIGAFNGDSLLLRSGDVEATKSLSWIKPIHETRICFSQEMTIAQHNTKPINGNLLKTLSGGGDEIVLRTNHKNEEKLIFKSLIIIMANGLPEISPKQEALTNRIIAIPYSFSFVENPVAEHHKPIDRSLDDKLKGCEDSFIHLVLDTLRSWNGKEPELPQECKELLEEVAPLPNIRELLEERFEITKNPNDFVETKYIIQHLKSRGLNDTDQALGRQLTDLGIPVSQKKIHRQNVKIRVGIRLLPDEE